MNNLKLELANIIFKQKLSKIIIKKINNGPILLVYKDHHEKDNYIYLNDKKLKLCQVTINFEILPNLSNLTQLEIIFCDLKEIPIELFQLKKLEILNLILNKIENIPKDIDQLTNLKYLNLSYNQITNIDNLCGLENLINLNLSNNNILKISNKIYNLKKLIKLNISDNKLSNINKLKFNKFLYLKNLDISKIKFNYKIIKGIYFDELIVDYNEQSEDWHCLDLSDLHTIMSWGFRYDYHPEMFNEYQEDFKKILNKNINIKMYIGNNNKKWFYNNDHTLEYRHGYNHKFSKSIKKFIIIYNMARLIHIGKLN